MSQIFVHIVDITRAPFLAAELFDRLSSDEQKRADRLKVADKRAQFIASRCALRSLLAQHCGQAANDICFDYNSAGKPSLRSGDWHFNISHSHRRMIMACSQDLPLGVDVEHIDQSCDFEPLAKRFFSVDEFRAVMLHREDDIRRAFYSCWTAKEAVLKCIGCGIDRALDSFVIGSLQHLNANPRSVHGMEQDYQEFIHHIDAGRDYYACLACADAEPVLIVERQDLTTVCV